MPATHLLHVPTILRLGRGPYSLVELVVPLEENLSLMPALSG